MAAQTESIVHQLTQADYFGFMEELIRRAISEVGPDQSSIARWLIESGEKPNPEVAERILK